MGWDTTQAEYDEWFDVQRGGDQGDYREGMQAKIDNVVDCLAAHPHSKRAIIPIPFNSGRWQPPHAGIMPWLWHVSAPWRAVCCAAGAC